MNHYKIYMFDVPYVYVLVNTYHKFSLECMQNFIPTCLGSLTEIGSVFHSIKVYYHEKCFRKIIMPLMFKCILEIKKDHTFQFLLVLLDSKLFGET